MTALAQRVFRRAQRVAALREPAQRAQDLWEMADFWLHAARRRALAARVGECRAVEQWVDLASDVFDPHQFRSEITAFLTLARERHPRRVCEIGVASGGTNFLLCQALPEVTFALGIDLFVRHRRQLRSFARPDQRLCFIDGSSYAPETVARASRSLAGEPLDLLFIDGDHSYDGVRADFLAYRPFVRDGALIAFHDIVPDHFTRYGRPSGRDAGGVPQLWRELRDRYEHWEYIENPEQDGLGIGVIAHRRAVALPDCW